MEVSPNLQLLSWYVWPLAGDVWANGAMPIIPVFLEKLARQVGYWGPEMVIPCSEAVPNGMTCRLPIMGRWVDTSSLSVFVDTIGLVSRMACLLAFGSRTDNPRTRKIVFSACIYVGSLSSILFLLLPYQALAVQPYLAGVLSIIATDSYVFASMCYMSWLPILATNIHQQKPRTDAQIEDPQETDPLIVRSTEEGDSASTLSKAMAKISSIGVTLNCWGGVAICLVLQWILNHTHVGITTCLAALGLWWATIGTIPAVFLPGGAKQSSTPITERHSAQRHLSMFGVLESLGKLSQVRKLFVAHVVAFDGFALFPNALALYSSTHLSFSFGDILAVSVFLSVLAVIWTPLQPFIQRKLGATNLQMLIFSLVCGSVSPLWMCLGIISPKLAIQSKWQCYAAGLGYAIGCGPYATYYFALRSELTPKGYESSIASVSSLAASSTTFLGSLVLGGILQATGRYDVAFLFFALAMAVSLPLFGSIDMDQGVKEAKAFSTASENDRPSL